ncbi:hypothetical protein [Rhodococcus qingshengii]|nr:hypothetical protein [Rhodococcus qingshengii]
MADKIEAASAPHIKEGFLSERSVPNIDDQARHRVLVGQANT